MIIKSVFQRGTRTAVASFRFAQEKGVLGGEMWRLYPGSVWRSSPSDRLYGDAVISDGLHDLNVVVSPNRGSDSKKNSPISRMLGRYGVEAVDIAEPFEPAQALTVHELAKIQGQLNFSEFAEYDRMNAELKQLEKTETASALAYLQGILFVDESLQWQGPSNTVAIMRLGGSTSGYDYGAPFGVSSLRGYY